MLLSKVNPHQTIEKKEYKLQRKELNNRLKLLQQRIKELEIPVCIVFEGWSASGKGTIISKILNPIDPRYVNVYSMQHFSQEALMRPLLYNYFTKMPSKGRMSIFDKSWHRSVLPEGVTTWKLTEQELQGFFYDVNSFEKMHSEDGTVIIKLFLHISKEEQKSRFKFLQSNESTKWRIDEKDVAQNESYHQYVHLFEQMLSNTNGEDTPWHIIEADDIRFATIKVLNTLIEQMEVAIAKKEASMESMSENIRSSEITIKEMNQPTIFDEIDPNKTIEDELYKEQLEQLQKRIREIENTLYAKRKSVVIVFEGWDAAGKGGAIKRLTEEMDPRGYEVNPIAAPTKEELDHHYLWRFFQKLPKDGHIAIFDRSWYGRVMVERIEGFCTTEEWQRAYQEINDMERHMANHGTMIFKFWLHIDQEEQLARFLAREENPLKRYKITEEDWRNRDKWDQYKVAVSEMVTKTDTPYAPWTIISANHKKYARIKLLERVVEQLTMTLK